MRIGGYQEAGHWKSYTLAHAGVECYEKLVHDFEVHGRQHIPKDSGLIVAPSHRDGYDSIAAGAAINRPVAFMAKEEMWTSEYDFTVSFINKTLNAGNIASYFDAYPVNRKRPSSKTWRHTHDLVNQGRAVGIFPEMSRYEDEEKKIVRGQKLGHLFPGVGRLALATGAKILPMGLCVKRELNGKGKLKIVKVAAVINEAIETIDDPEMPRKLVVAKTMAEVRESLQDAHDNAARLAA